MTASPPPGFRYRADPSETAYSFLQVRFIDQHALMSAWMEWLDELGLPSKSRSIALRNGSAPKPIWNLATFVPSSDHLARAYAVSEGLSAAAGDRIEFAFLDQTVVDLLSAHVSRLSAMPGFTRVQEDLRGLMRIAADDAV